jgi:hypothetical protein
MPNLCNFVVNECFNELRMIYFIGSSKSSSIPSREKQILSKNGEPNISSYVIVPSDRIIKGDQLKPKYIAGVDREIKEGHFKLSENKSYHFPQLDA